MCDPVAVAGVTGRLPGKGTRIGDLKGDAPLSELNLIGLAYFDTAHFGSMLPKGSKIEIQAGFGDTTCPSTGMIALWNAVTVEKTLIFSQNKDHSGKNPNVFNNADLIAETQIVITVPAQEN
jgi:cephalosporin-C deacetylase-like acetyl esterase